MKSVTAILIGNIHYTYIKLPAPASMRRRNLEMAVYYRQIEENGEEGFFQQLCRGKGIVHVRITRREREWKDVEELTIVF